MDEDVVNEPLEIQIPLDPSVVPDDHFKPPQPPKEEDEVKSTPPQTARPWRLNYYQPYFQTDSVTVFSRLLKAVKPTLDGEFFNGVQADLYAPFWIFTTLILIVGISGSIEASIYSGTWLDTLTKIGIAAALLYSILALVPLASYFILKRSGSTIDYVTILSMYGYSFFIFVPALLLCMIPIGILQLTVMLVAGAWSLAILVKNYWNEVVNVFREKRYLVLLLMASGHAGFLVTCLLYFFNVDTS